MHRQACRQPVPCSCTPTDEHVTSLYLVQPTHRRIHQCKLENRMNMRQQTVYDHHSAEHAKLNTSMYYLITDDN